MTDDRRQTTDNRSVGGGNGLPSPVVCPPSSVFEYTLRLADNALILGHRLSEWCGHAPVLEEDLALPNMALDLIGQARALYAYAAELEGEGRHEEG